MQIPSHVFRAYDIRGLAIGEAPELTPSFAYLLGRAYVRFLKRENETPLRFVVGHDNRTTGPALAEALIAGMQAEGAEVSVLGYATSPYLYFAVCEGGFDGGINITGSHNPPMYNGFKLTRAGAAPIGGDEIQQIRTIAEGLAGESVPDAFLTTSPSVHFRDAYFTKLCALAPMQRKLKIVIDCGNGTASFFAPELLRSLGHEIVALYAESDPTFPHHLPDPEDESTLAELQARVVAEKADLGLAWDGDADRVGVIDERGRILPPDELMVILTRDLLARQPGATIVFDIKAPNRLAAIIAEAGGELVRARTGHVFIKQAMRETGALLGGEMSGHLFFGEDYVGVDDGLLAALRIASIVSVTDAPLSSLVADLPEAYITPDIKLPVDDRVKFAVVTRIVTDFEKDFACETTDGVRFTFPDGAWGLIRASNTSPYLTLRLEAGDATRLTQLIALMGERLASYPELDLTSLRALIAAEAAPLN